MYSVFLLCFAVGALLSIAMAILGATDDIPGLAHHVTGPAHTAGHAHAGDAPHAHDVHGDSAGSAAGHAVVWAVSWLSPLTIGGFLLAFGGVGLLLGGSAFVVPAAIVAGLVLAAAIRALMRAFMRASSPGLSAEPEGAIGTVIAAVAPGGTGEISFDLEGQPRTTICRAEDASMRIPRGTQVVITRRAGGYAYIEPLEPLEASDPPVLETGATTQGPERRAHS